MGAARGITLPKSWLDYLERKTGCRITEVAIEINGALTVRPIIPKEEIPEPGLTD